MAGNRRWWATLAGVALIAAGCSADDPATGNGSAEEEEEEVAMETVFPGDEWAHADPAELGFDPRRLDELASEARAIGSNCLLVARHGRIAGEWYWNDTDAGTRHQVWSVTKSYTSTLVGIARDEGRLEIDDRASDYVDQWAGTPSGDVTIRNILSNDSGRRSTGAGVDAALTTELFTAKDRTAFSLGLDQVAPPGTAWSNNEAAIQALDAVLTAATGREPAAYARAELLEPIGARHTEMTTDEAGNTNMFALLETTCRDAARFGHLFLHHGRWDGRQVVSEEWVAQATQPSQDLHGGYGFLWWLNRQRRLDPAIAADIGADPDATQTVPGAPETMYWSHGAFGQIIQVDPDSDTVVVRFGVGQGIYDPAAGELTARIVTETIRE